MKGDNMESFSEKLNDYIRALYPVIYIPSREQDRTLKILKAIAVQQKRPLYLWSPIETKYTPLVADKALQVPNTTIESLEQAIEGVKNLPELSMVVFLNVHNILEQDWLSAQRILKLVGTSNRKAKRNILIVSPRMVISEYLDKETVVIEQDLPSREEITEVFNTFITNNSALLGNKKIDEKLLNRAVQAALGMTKQEVENAVALSAVKFKAVNDEAVTLISKEKTEAIKRTGFLEIIETDLNIEDVGGLENVKNWLKKRKQAFSKEARDYGLPYPKGVLLVGIPGCGKSLLSKVIAGYFNFPLVRFDISRVFGSLVGQSESNVRLVLQLVDTIAPCVLWIDELEKAFSGLNGVSTDSGTTKKVLGNVLTWMQERTSPAFIIATANEIEALPPELIRRFDATFFVDLPNEIEREQIYNIHLKRRKRDTAKFDVKSLANISADFTGAEIEEAINEGMITAFDEGTEVTTEHIQKAISNTVPLIQTMQERMTALRAWAKDRAMLASKPIIKPVENDESPRQALGQGMYL